MAKMHFEKKFWETAAAEISYHHSYNGISLWICSMMIANSSISLRASLTWVQSMKTPWLSMSLKPIFTWRVHGACFSPLLGWGVDDLSSWGFAVKHAARIHNHMPSHTSGLNHLELLNKTKAYHGDFLHSHVWGCLVFILDPKLQDGKKIPQLNQLSQLGQFKGFSEEHSSLAAHV